MKKVLFNLLILCFSLTIFSCFSNSDSGSSTTSTTTDDDTTTTTGTKQWAQEAYIKAVNNNSSIRASFGYAGARISGDTLAVGAMDESSNQKTITNGTTASSNTSGSNSGAVYVYKRSGTSWVQEA